VAHAGGTPVATALLDIDGNVRGTGAAGSATAPSIGCHEGTTKPYQNYSAPVPANLAVANPGSDGDLRVTWLNALDYEPLDMVIIYDNDTGNEVGRAPATDGTMLIAGFTNNVPYNLVARGISDNGIESADSAVVQDQATSTVTADGTVHLVCAVAADEESIRRYLWFISPTHANALVRQTAAQAQINAREYVTDYDFATDDPSVEIGGLVGGDTYWAFVVAIDEDELGTDILAKDVLEFVATRSGGVCIKHVIALDHTRLRIS